MQKKTKAERKADKATRKFDKAAARLEKCLRKLNRRTEAMPASALPLKNILPTEVPAELPETEPALETVNGAAVARRVLPVKLTKPEKPPVPGDMVVNGFGHVGLLVEVRPTTARGARVLFGNSGPWKFYGLRRLRRASMAEIKAAGLDQGVGIATRPASLGCNRGNTGWKG